MERAIFAINRTIKFMKQTDKIRAMELSTMEYYMINSVIFLFLLFSLLLFGLAFTVVHFFKTIWFTAKLGLNRIFAVQLPSQQTNHKKIR